MQTQILTPPCWSRASHLSGSNAELHVPVFYIGGLSVPLLLQIENHCSKYAYPDEYFLIQCDQGGVFVPRPVKPRPTRVQSISKGLGRNAGTK